MIVSEPIAGYSAETSGIKAGDEILSINGKRVHLKNELNNAINKSQGNEISIEIKRNNENMIITTIPTQDDNGNYLIGINLKPAETTFGNRAYYGFWSTVYFSGSIIDNLKELFTGGVKTEQLMGPIGISTVVSQTNGFVDFVYILALISLSLGVTNLLPFPPLDGGKFILLVIEAIRRKKLSTEVELNIQSAGFILMILLSIYVAYNDLLRIF